MPKLSLEILKLCLQYRRCRSCGRIKPRHKMRMMGCSLYHCPICRAEKIDLRDEYLQWYSKEGQKLEGILPNPLPSLTEIRKMIKQAKRERGKDAD